ncbi:class I SAM-dependent methyltransferase [Desulfopila inferna]|uniref:class I SAM-dependent methyltransferase n=1 Tax=Desulfopila inferna TaxID=468528 RepID=UPI001965FFCC|nr:class I SAM-dependent methyltransferase [Desulfopila inferna]MBM9602700.1 class I SAM-dependent methyltransferase [Desulfopila inferna]
MGHLAENSPPLIDTVASCPLCGADSCIHEHISKVIHERQYDIYKCNSCTVCFTYPVPSAELLTRIYSGEYWLREGKVNVPKKNLTGLVQKFNTIRLAAMVKPLVRHLKPGDRILEVGCGSGQLAVYLQECGFNIEVTDVSTEILEEISDLHKIKGYCGDLQDISFDDEPYQAVIFNNVLEHLDDPEGNLRQACQLLDRNGLVFVEVPNIESFQFKLFGEKWFPLQLPEHLYHFSPISLQKIAGKCGLIRAWMSTLSPRVSSAGYVATIFPFLRPERLRFSMSKPLLGLYLGLQVIFLPIAFVESLLGKGSAVRIIFKKEKE